MNLRPAALLLAILGLGLAAPAAAGPLDEGHVGIPGFSGPTSGDLGAVYWNPAALGLMRDRQLMLVGAVRQTTTTVRRSSIDPATGASPGPLAFQPATSRVVRHPGAPLSAQYLPYRLDKFAAPGSMVALGGAIQERWSLAVAMFTPFSHQARFSPTDSGGQPARYHVVDTDIQHLTLAPSLAIRVGTGFYLGTTVGWLSSRGHLSWDEDTGIDSPDGSEPLCDGQPCGLENPAAAERYRLEDVTLFDDVINSLAVGMLLRRGRMDLGLSYTKGMIGSHSVTIIPNRTAVDRAPRFGGGEQLVTSELYYRLPDMATLGLTWRARRLSWTGMARWIRYGKHGDVAFRLAGPGLRQEMNLFRGYRDNLDLRARAVLGLGERWRLSATLRGETTAVSSSHVTPASVDGLKIEPTIATEVTLGFLRLSAAYSFLIIPNVKVEQSAFNARAALECSAQGHDLTTPACRLRSLGAARSSGAGRYRLFQHAGSVTATLWLPAAF